MPFVSEKANWRNYGKIDSWSVVKFVLTKV